MIIDTFASYAVQKAISSSTAVKLRSPFSAGEGIRSSCYD